MYYFFFSDRVSILHFGEGNIHCRASLILAIFYSENHMVVICALRGTIKDKDYVVICGIILVLKYSFYEF